MTKPVGVYKYNSTTKWSAQIGFHGRTYVLGVFDDIEEAVKVRKEAEKAREAGRFAEWLSEFRPDIKFGNDKKRMCIVCGKEFVSHNGRTVCSPECKKIRLKQTARRTKTKNNAKSINGIYYVCGKWAVYAAKKGVMYYLGTYSDECDARKAKKEFMEYCGDDFRTKAQEIKERVPKMQKRWVTGYEHALQYYCEKGNLLVPALYKSPDGYKLGQWIQTQRNMKKGTLNGTISQQKEKMLNQIGMVWDARASRLQ